MVREIVFDTETTGFNPGDGHRLVEIGAVELINHLPTGRTYHQYINPEREVPEAAYKVHGLDLNFLKDYPTFDKVANEFLEFIGDDVLVAHNAQFDVNFIDFELKAIGKKTLNKDKVIDTLEIAKNKFPGARNNLDALCKRFNIDNSNRTYHGALLDSELLADVYLELLGGREPGLLLDKEEKNIRQVQNLFTSEIKIERNFKEARKFELDKLDYENHLKFLERIKDNIWNKEEKKAD